MLNLAKDNVFKGILFCLLVFFIGPKIYAAIALHIDGTQDSYIMGDVGVGTTTCKGKLNIAGQYGSDIKVKGGCSGNVTIDWNEGTTQHLILTGDVTLTFTNGISGRKYTLIIKQDATG